MRHQELPAVLLLFAVPSLAQEVIFTVDPTQSETGLVSNFSVDLPGTLIGDYDADTNPEGTRTLPGLFGGSGNQPIDSAFGLLGEANLVGQPTGGFVLQLDPDSGLVVVEGLNFDLLGGKDGSSDLLLHLEFETFRTFSPDSLYIGDFPLDLPIGSQVITDVVLTQIGPGGGTLEVGDASFAINALVPAALSFAIVVGEDLTPVGPLPLLLPLAGTLTPTDAGMTAYLGFDLLDSQVIEDPLPGFTIDDLPLELPTIIPPGELASLLLNAIIAQIGVDTDLSLELIADGEAPCGFESYCLGEFNSTGQAAVLSALGSPAIGADDLTFQGVGMPPHEFAYLMMATRRDEIPFFRGSQGTLCLQMPILMFTPHVIPIDAAGVATIPVDFANLPPDVSLLAGDVWNFQFWYRDFNPGSTTNTSNAIEVSFCR